MRIYIDGTINPTCLRVGVFLFGKPRFVRQVYPRKKKPKKSKLRVYFRTHWRKILAYYVIEPFAVMTTLGLEDAAVTAMGVGTLYSVWGHAYSLLQRYLTIRHIYFAVTPIYGKIFFKAKINCIVKLSLGKTILVLFDFLKEAYGNERTSDMRSYDHSYAKH